VNHNDPLARLQALKLGTRLPRTVIFPGLVDEALLPGTQLVPLAQALKRADADVTLKLFPVSDTQCTPWASRSGSGSGPSFAHRSEGTESA